MVIMEESNGCFLRLSKGKYPLVGDDLIFGSSQDDNRCRYLLGEQPCIPHVFEYTAGDILDRIEIGLWWDDRRV